MKKNNTGSNERALGLARDAHASTAAATSAAAARF